MKCLSTPNKSLFLAALDNIKQTSNNYGPALNRHLPSIINKVTKKKDLVSPELITEITEILLKNGGKQAEQVLKEL